MPTPPTDVADFKAQFPREFVYGTQLSQVLDADINRCMNEATMVFNADLWEDATARDIAFLYASAHFLVQNLQTVGGTQLVNTAQALNSKGGGTVVSKSVGGVAVQYALPPSITEDKMLSGFMHTDFGQRYLQLLTPRLVGGGFVVEGYRDDNVFPQNNSEDVPMIFSTGNFNINTADDINLYGSVVPHYMFYVMDISEVAARIILAQNGTIKGLLFRANSNTLNGQTVVTVFKNGVAQALTCNLAAAALDGEDPVGTFNALAGDEISIKVDCTASSTGSILSMRATLKIT